MILTIKETNYNINRFNLTIGPRGENDALEHYVIIDFDLNTDFEEVSSQILEDFEGSFIVSTSMKDYEFTGYKLDDISFNISSTEERISLRLVKPIV